MARVVTIVLAVLIAATCSVVEATGICDSLRLVLSTYFSAADM